MTPGSVQPERGASETDRVNHQPQHRRGTGRRDLQPNDAELILLNATVSGNRADEGAIYGNNFPDIRISFTTIANNTALTTGGRSSTTPSPATR